MNKYVRKLFGVMSQGQQTQHSPTSPEEWRQHWQSQGQSWRTEPEINTKRQEELDKCRVVAPNIEKGIYPFKGMKLSRADVEWLLATHENGKGPVNWHDENQRERRGLDLRGAILSQTDLQKLPLASLLGGLGGHLEITEHQWDMAAMFMEGVNLSGARLENADLSRAHMKGAELTGTYLEEAFLGKTHLEDAYLHGVYMPRANLSGVYLVRSHLMSGHLEEAYLGEAHLEKSLLCDVHLESADLEDAHLEEADLSNAHLEDANLRGTHLENANLTRAHLDRADLTNVFLSFENGVGPLIVDVRWSNASLSAVQWSKVNMLGDEYVARQRATPNGPLKWPKDKTERLLEYEMAVRANQQLAVALQTQGLTEDAARFAYRGQVLQRNVFWRRHDFGKWLFSLLLALVAGYGYRIWRILVAYLFIVSICAIAYFILGKYYTPHLSLLQAFLESITAFHGRVFLELFSSETPQIWVTAAEAVLGLLIESVFIAMLTQRFFGGK